MVRSCYKFDHEKSVWAKAVAELKPGYYYVKRIQINGKLMYLYIDPIASDEMYAFTVAPEDRG